MKKAIVTGGAGFIGSNLVDDLISKGIDVTVIDNESSDCNEEFYWNPESNNYILDICDYDSIKPLFKNVDVVFHVAAEARIQPTLENPILAAKTNFLGTCTVLQCAKEAGVKRVVYSSTSSAYGLKNDIPNVEIMNKDCLNPYSVTKVGGEELCKMYTNLFGLETVFFRYFNVYGERQPIKGQYAPVIGIFLRQKSNGEPMTVVGDGEQRRDFTHVKDVVKANILAADLGNKKIVGELFNIGTGKNHSILEIKDLISGDFIHIPERKGEARLTLANNEKAKILLGWTPTVELEEWIKTA
jgi:UDP-glucose 4-epimerase|tara:strand:+ start:4779 stop:5675 length:897 start_codon:yes stop_codon:yes gene_type:complete